MLRITKEADYGIVLLAHMAGGAPGSMHTAREISERSGLSLPMAGKILRSLARGGILTSHRGVSGGYSFDRDPTQTSVAAVIRAVEGPISMVQCGVEPGACEQEAVCPTRVNWARISREVEDALEKVPISEMIVTSKSSGVLSL